MLLAYGVSNFAGSLLGATLAERRLILLVSGVALIIGLSMFGIGASRHLQIVVGVLVCLWAAAAGGAVIDRFRATATLLLPR